MINVFPRQIFFSLIDVNVIIPLKEAIIGSNTINLPAFSYVNRYSKQQNRRIVMILEVQLPFTLSRFETVNKQHIQIQRKS